MDGWITTETLAVSQGVRLHLISAPPMIALAIIVVVVITALSAVAAHRRLGDEVAEVSVLAAVIASTICLIGWNVLTSHANDGNLDALRSYYGISNVACTDHMGDNTNGDYKRLPMDSSDATVRIRFIDSNGRSESGRLVVAEGVARVFTGPDSNPRELTPARTKGGPAYSYVAGFTSNPSTGTMVPKGSL